MMIRLAANLTAGVCAEFLDFRDRSRGRVGLDDVESQINRGRYVWIDVDATAVDPATVFAALPACCQGHDLDRLLTDCPEHAEQTARLARHEGLLHVVLTGGPVVGPEAAGERLDIVLTAGLLLTLHRGPNAVLAAVRRDYVHDFERHATTPSFLVYEIFNEQVEQFLAIQGRLDDDVEAARLALRNDADEAAFGRVAEVADRLLALRRRVLPTRRVLEELVSRKTTLVSEATLGFLGMMIQSLERLLADIAANREILENALNLSLTVMSHRTNQTMNRLAVVSTIFLPLTFLCGVYGMNFPGIPETSWQYGYVFFWAVSASITGTLVWFLRRARLL